MTNVDMVMLCRRSVSAPAMTCGSNWTSDSSSGLQITQNCLVLLVLSIKETRFQKLIVTTNCLLALLFYSKALRNSSIDHLGNCSLGSRLVLPVYGMVQVLFNGFFACIIDGWSGVEAR